MKIAEILKQLTLDEKKVLWWKSQGLKYEAIGLELGYGVEWVQLRMSSVYLKLGIRKDMHWKKRLAFLKNDVYPLVPKDLDLWIAKTPEEPDVVNALILPPPEIIAIVLVDEEMENDDDDDDSKKIIVVDKKRREKGSSSLVPIVIGVVVCFLVSLVGYIAYQLGRGSVPFISETPQSEVLPGQTLGIETAYTQSLPDASTPTIAPVPTNSPTSPPPTYTSIPTQTNIPLLAEFFDDFSDGLDPAWTVVSGNPMVVNEQLTSSDAAVLSIGNPLWRNYEIEFDIKIPTGFCGLDNDRENFVGIRALDFDNMLRFDFDTCETAWHIVSAGEALTVPNTPTGYRMGSGGKMHIVVTAVDDKISLRVDTKLINSFIDSTFQSGIIFIRLRPDSLYDNFSITVFD